MTHCRPRLALAASAAVLVLAALAPSACSSRAAAPGGSDAGPMSDAGDAGDAGTKSDAGAPDSGAPPCTSDSTCGTARYCEQATGVCRDAKPCPQGQGNCDFGGSDYCGTGQCFCDTDSACKPIHRACAPCARSLECGTDRLAYDHPADCLPGDAGPGDAGLCIPRKDNGCPVGYNFPTDGGIYCVPAGGKCGAPGACTSSAGCDPHGALPECDTAHGVCASACSFDLKTGESSCATGLVCHVDPRLLALAPQESNWAKGRCGPPCAASSDCDGGLSCRGEGVEHSVERCTIAAGCLGDVECPDSPGTHSLGYCDLQSRACKTDCRTTGDCHAGYLCASGSCVAETCLQAGGASLGCEYGQFCCGEQGGPASCAAGVDAGACYGAPKATWCDACSADADCRTAALPNQPADAGAPNVCLDPGSGAKLCWIGCDPHGPAAQCPRSWQCQAITVGCKQSSDCGSQATARCDNPDGGGGTCACSADADCPQDASQHFASSCKQGKCTITTACRPNCQ